MADTYGLLTDLDQADGLPQGRRARPKALRIAYIVTDDDRRFQARGAPPARRRGAGAAVRVVPDQFRVRQRGLTDEVHAEGLPGRCRHATCSTNLQKARKRWHEDGDRHAFSLTAATGAGKTVMAAAVFEALFHGDDDYDFDADPGAVVIWFSDDPSLNEQTRFRLMEASDRLTTHDLGGGGKHLQPREVRGREGSTSSTRRSWARRACWCAASTRMTMTPDRGRSLEMRPDCARLHDLGHDPQHHRRPGR